MLPKPARVSWCCVGAALLQAGLKEWRAGNACETGPRRLAMSPHISWGAPTFGRGCGRRVSHVPRRERGPRHALLLPTTSFTYFLLLLLLLLTTYYPGEWVLPNKVAPARGVHAMPEGGVGGGACTSRFLQLWVPGTNLLGPKLSRNDAKASPPGARRKGRRALLPLATVRSRAERIPRTNSKRVFSAKGQSQPAMQRGSSVVSG